MVSDNQQNTASFQYEVLIVQLGTPNLTTLSQYGMGPTKDCIISSTVLSEHKACVTTPDLLLGNTFLPSFGHRLSSTVYEQQPNFFSPVHRTSLSVFGGLRHIAVCKLDYYW